MWTENNFTHQQVAAANDFIVEEIPYSEIAKQEGLLH
jgi:hypothetical protein